MTAKTIPFVETVEDARVRGVFPATGVRPRVVRPSWDQDQQRIYCVSCHHPGGFISSDIPGIIYLCDRFSKCGCNCAETKGELTLPKLAI